jgi:hypothetical protein
MKNVFFPIDIHIFVQSALQRVKLGKRSCLLLGQVLVQNVTVDHELRKMKIVEVILQFHIFYHFISFVRF